MVSTKYFYGGPYQPSFVVGGRRRKKPQIHNESEAFNLAEEEGVFLLLQPPHYQFFK